VWSIDHVVHTGVSRARNINALFFMLGWAQCESHKKRIRTHSGASRTWSIDALFFMLSWVHCESHKKHAGTHYAELAFLHLMQSVGHIVHFGSSVAWNINALFFMLGWVQSGSYKKRALAYYTELVFLHVVRSAAHVVHSLHPERETLIHYFSCSGGSDADPLKSVSRHVTQNLCFCILCDMWIT
jgi:hypothetical protein